MSVTERLRTAFGLHEFARRRLETALRRESPGCSERALAHEVMRRFLGDGWKAATALADSEE
jgi:hypothetical protein